MNLKFEKATIRLFSLIILYLLLLANTFAYASPVEPLDIKTHWARQAVNAASAEGWALIFNNRFQPNKPATREEVIWMLVSALEKVKVNGIDLNKKSNLSKYKDSPTYYARDKMSIALANSLIKGYSNKTLKPKSSITRSEFAVMLTRLLSQQRSGIYSPFSDIIPNWAIEAVKTCYVKGIIGGYSDGTFKANSKVTKAEALAMISRWKMLQIQRPNPSSIPEVFKQIEKKIPKSSINEDSITYSLNFTIINSPKSSSYLMMIKGFNDKDSLDKVKETFKAFFPKEYETAYSELTRTLQTHKKSADLTFDGRKFSCDFMSNMLVVNIAKQAAQTGGEQK